jgi:CRISPR-associated endonuclease/helicase Cas3
MYTIHLQSVDSCEATAEELDAAGIDEAQIPIGKDGQRWRVMAHQARTVTVLRYGNAPIIINQAMTGDGKTFAGQFTLFNDKTPTFAMYPTNELARDQQRSLQETLTHWMPPPWLPKGLLYRTINAAEMDAIQADAPELSRMETIEGLLDSDAILTNPDIFHWAMQFGYKQYGTAHDLILGELAHRYRLFVFDEFHLFGTPQIASVLIAMLLMLEISKVKQPPRFLFLSATPSSSNAQGSPFTVLAQNAGLSIEYVSGEYQHGVALLPGWRRILRQAALTLYSGRLDAWVDEHFEDVILRFFREQRPAAKGVIIANGVATAHRIYRKLQANCEATGIHLGINTGATPLADRGTTEMYDLIVATSTVDVGVDFRINLLIFESNDAASHKQRLGRLGRHDTDSDGTPFEQFEAHAVLPDWVVEAVKAKYPPDASANRQEYHQIISESFSSLQEFRFYNQKWAGVQAQHILSQLRKPEIRTQYRDMEPRLRTTYKLLFPAGYPQYKRLVDDDQQETLNAARSFRGSSPFTALFLDPTTPSKAVMSYNLITLLRQADLMSMDMEDILRHAEKVGQKRKALLRADALAAYRLVDWLPQARPVQIWLDAPMGEEQWNIVIETRGVRFDAPDVPDLHRLNRDLETKTLVALFLRNQDPDSLRRVLKLGYQLELFKFTHRGGTAGAVAFGRDALLLDSAWQRKKQKGGDAPLIF